MCLCVCASVYLPPPPPPSDRQATSPVQSLKASASPDTVRCFVASTSKGQVSRLASRFKADFFGSRSKRAAPPTYSVGRTYITCSCHCVPIFKIHRDTRTCVLNNYKNSSLQNMLTHSGPLEVVQLSEPRAVFVFDKSG